MRGLRGILRRKRNRLIVLLLIFIIVDIALISYTFSYTTDTKPGVLVQSDLPISEGKTSAFGNSVFVAEGSLYRFTPSGLVKFQGSDNLTSYAFAYLSETVVAISEDKVFNFYPQGSVVPAYSKVMDADTTVLCIREQASGHQYITVDIAILSTNQTGSYFVPVAAGGQSAPGTETLLPGAMVSQASARSGGYTTIACDDGSLVTFRMGRQGVIASIPYEGGIRDMAMVDNGMKLYVLHQDGSVLSVKPANGDVYGWTNISSTVSELVLGEDGETVYTLDGDRLMAVSGPAGEQVFSGNDITAFAVPGSTNLVICQKGYVTFWDLNRGHALWDSKVNGVCLGAETIFGAPSILIWTDTGDLYSYDNSNPTMGAKEWWQVTGAVVILQLLTLVGLAWGRGVLDNGTYSLIVLFAGAMAGLVMTIFLPNQNVVDWFGGELPVAAIVMVSGAVACYVAWESGSGIWGIILGVISGIVAASITGLVMMFLLWATGTDFGGEDAFFSSLVNSVPIGFTASIAAGIIGYVMTYLLVSGEKKKTRG